jgi:hypothetical protein
MTASRHFGFGRKPIPSPSVRSRLTVAGDQRDFSAVNPAKAGIHEKHKTQTRAATTPSSFSGSRALPTPNFRWWSPKAFNVTTASE